jgi:hypothetical protein
MEAAGAQKGFFFFLISPTHIFKEQFGDIE